MRTILFLLFLSPLLAWASLTCHYPKPIPVALAPSVQERAEKRTALFHKLADVIDKKRDALANILNKFNTKRGSDYEINQSIKLLKNFDSYEAYFMNNIPELNSIAVFGSTNVPLYTLIARGVLPASTAKDVWFRTPETTRQIYVELFNELKSGLGQGDLENLHLLTETNDTQYDVFRKKYILGLNKKTTEVVRPPADVVIFVGNQDTAQKIIEQNIQKLESLGDKVGPHRQLFLGFGTGMNPVVILPPAAKKLERTVDLILEPIGMNCGQDCQAPNFYLLPHTNQAPVIKAVLDRVKAMKPGESSDPNADYSPLGFLKTTDKLTSYKEKYRKYLVNPDATLDTETKMVSPHIFVFPFSMFKEVELQEHYAPFFTFFVYDNPSDIGEMAKDLRVQQKAMHASVLTDDLSNHSLQDALYILRKERHAVNVNIGSYEDRTPNMAFGGRGTDSSMIVTMESRPGEKVLVKKGHHPVLFSEEVELHFGNPSHRKTEVIKPPTYFQSKLEKLIDEASGPVAKVNTFYPEWKNLQNPQMETGPRGIQATRKLAAEKGIQIVLPDASRASEKQLKEMEKFWGIPIYRGQNNNGKSPAKVPGVVLHPAEVGKATAPLNVVRGEINPHLGYGMLHAILEDNKKLEYELAEAISPGIMATTDSLGDLQKKGILQNKFAEKRTELLEDLKRLTTTGNQLSDEQRITLRKKLKELIEQVFQDVRKYHPDGAYFKNFGEYATADFGTTVTSFGTSPQRIADEFLRRFETSLASNYLKSQFDSPQFTAQMNAVSREMYRKFTQGILLNPDEILVQQKVKIDQTEQGNPMEFRVDFADGEAVTSRLRYGNEYYPAEVAEAKKITNEFFAKAPEKLRYTSGGIDVARLRDGSWKIIEFNFGTASGTMMPQLMPVDSNQYFSELAGKPTHLIATLNGVFSGGLEKQREYLKTLKHEKELIFKHSLEDFSVQEAGKYFRNKHLDAWTKNPTKESAETTLASIKAMLAGFYSEENEEIPKLIDGAELYMNRILRERANQSQPRATGTGQ